MDSSDISPPAVQRKEPDTKGSGSPGNVKAGKNGASKEMGHSILNSINKSALQIKKPPHRKTSPLNWFPRKKTDSYLKRKIKLLQEVGGMNSSLDETLGDSNPHYSRVEREKIAAREAARKAMEARKAAMVEASWCRILQAARIQSKEAELLLSKAEESAAEAFEEAAAVEVTMHDRPNYPRQPWDVETSSITGGGSTHTVTASFETAFEVDKEVAAAVKTAFIQLAKCPNSSNKEEFRELLWKISQNPDTSEANHELSVSSECELDKGPEFESAFDSAGSSSSSDVVNRQKRARKWKNRKVVMNNIPKAGLVDIMLSRLKCLQEEELASLATIVATCGLNAVLLEEESNKRHDSTTRNYTVGPVLTSIRNMPPLGSSMQNSNTSFTDTQMKRKQQAVPELPSLDKLLVRHVSRLEREVQEAKNARKTDQADGSGKTMEKSDEHGTSSETVTNLGSILLRHTSRLEKEIEEAKKMQRSFDKTERLRDRQQQDVDHESSKESSDAIMLVENTDGNQLDKENIDFNKCSSMKMTIQTEGMAMLAPMKHFSRIERAKLETLEAFSASNENNSLDKILVKPMHRLEREKVQALASGNDRAISRDQKQWQGTEDTTIESLDKVLVKRISKLEKEKMAIQAKEDMVRVKKDDKQPVTTDGESLDKILVKHQSGLEKAKWAASRESAYHVRHTESRREARERELREAWGGLSLGNSIRPHLSRLERDKAAWRRAEEEEQRRVTELV